MQKKKLLESLATGAKQTIQVQKMRLGDAYK
jgi:hypothetical protein